MQKITPFLWFNGEAENAARFYVSLFKNSKILQIMRWGDAGPGPKGAVATVRFKLQGQEFLALNGGPEWKLTPAFSLVVNCNNQAEIDRYWKRLSDGGKEIQCGWLTDKFGVSWQVVPKELQQLLKDPKRADRVLQAVMGMVKLDAAELKRAYKGG